MGFPRWAPITWYIFHKLAFDYNESNRDHYKRFFESMRTVIPCKTCRNHFIQNTSLEENTLDANLEKEKIFSWTVRLHNMVNRMNKKKIFTDEEAKKLYEKPMAKGLLYMFINDYFMYNLNKGFDKDQQLMVMMTSLCYLFPDPIKREKLVTFVEKLPPTKEKIRPWLYVFRKIATQ
jgi:hypothetical protein